ncbi:MAG: hypothetical protein WAZ94_15100 [Phycisphaerales bacterium]|nr:hypothetical protein [Chloroflexota bacterium]
MRLGLWPSPGASEFARIATGLRKARQALAGGWAPCFSFDAQGKICAPDDEGVTLFCLHDAVAIYAPDVETILAAEDLLKIIADPSGRMTLYDWEEQPGRKQADVLAVFDRAIARATAASRKGTTWARG